MCLQGFFRRTVQNEQRLGRSPYTCQNADNCAIGRDSRNGCQACRFKKCLDSGMSTDCKYANLYIQHAVTSTYQMLFTSSECGVVMS